MKHSIAPRILAVLLALAMLVSMTAMAEIVITEDALPDIDESVVLEGGELELSDAPVDIDLSEALFDVSADTASVESIEGIASEPKGEQETNQDGEALILGVKERYALDVEAIGSGKKVTFKSSNRKIATVTSKGVIKGVKRGTAKITCKVGGKVAATYEVQVVAAPGEVTLEKTDIILGVKEYITLTPSIPDGTHASFTWSAKNKSIATVSQSGRITGKRVGVTTVTVETQNGKTAKVNVRVMKAPDKVTMDTTTASLKLNDTLQLKATLPSKTYSAITWSSSNESVAAVSDSGMVTALDVGKATITARTYNGKKATCKVTVSYKTNGEVVYRALLIGEVSFRGQDECERNRCDVMVMANMLKSIKGPDGGSYSITKRYNLSANQVLNVIPKAFADADDDDVSLFFIATHGDVDESGDFAGALAMSPSGYLLLKDLASALQAIPGKVIVILESCGSGAAVYANNANGGSDKKTLYEEAKRRAEAFDAAVIEAFSNVDSAAFRANTGEFRVRSKFYVLTASRYQELSWGWESGDPETSYNYFTLWLTEGIGTIGAMPADANRNGQTTLNELYQYISEVGDDYPFRSNNEVYYQHVQVYPANSGYVLFCR